MAVPTYDQFIEPVLRILAEHPNGVPAPVVHEAAADRLGLTTDDRAILLPSGVQRVYKNRAGWAHDRLKRAGLSSSPKHGFWKITSAGLDYLRAHPDVLSSADVQRIAEDFIGVSLKPPGANQKLTFDHPIADQPIPWTQKSVASPDDLLEEAIKDMNAAARAELLERLATVAPSSFELIVLDVLHKMGYGASKSDLTQVGGPGDGGIDGIISLDRLGLEKVYVQAKRWQSPVGRPDLQAFYGALAGQKAKKGVFITTSTFTPQARDFASSVEGMVLVDGQKLTSLMIEFEVGISSRTVKIPKVDSDYFEEESG